MIFNVNELSKNWENYPKEIKLKCQSSQLSLFSYKVPSVHILKYTQDTFQDSYTKYWIEFKADVLNYMNGTGASAEEALQAETEQLRMENAYWKIVTGLHS